MRARVLAINAGSSSIKAALFEGADGSLARVASASVDRLHTPDAALRVEGGWQPEKVGGDGGVQRSLDAVLAALGAKHGADLTAVGHRVVHGGALTESSLWAPAVADAVRRATVFAPLHNPANVACLEATAAALPGVPAVAVFDTAWHASLPAAVAAYAVPQAWRDGGWGERAPPVRKYGFHGISYQGLVASLAGLLGVDATSGVDAVAFHLGAGASAAAVSRSRSLDTTMGVTPTAGLISATRCGDLDPGLVIERVAAAAGRGDGAATIAADLRTLNSRAGLLGLAGIGSGDMRDVMAAAGRGDAAAHLALDAYAHRARSTLGAHLLHLAAAGTPARAIAFTGGVGEGAPGVRAAILAGLEGWAGVLLNSAANEAAVGPRAPALIHAPGSRLAIAVVPADEEGTIAREAARVVAEAAA